MKIFIVLNGYNLRRFPADTPDRLGLAAKNLGHEVSVEISESLEHMLDLVGKGVESGIEAIFAGGGDGTLHHLINHPLIDRVRLGMLPLGTINAFLRAARADYQRPVRCLKQLLNGRVVEGHVGRLNERRFACFVSWGFDARAAHATSTALKRKIGALAYGVAGMGELVRWTSNQVRGELEFSPAIEAPKHATSVIISKIDNYAGTPAFVENVESPKFEALLSATDSPVAILAMWATVGARGTFRRDLELLGTRHVTGFERLEWLSERPVVVQLDGEAITINESARLDVKIDTRRQRYLMPE